MADPRERELKLHLAGRRDYDKLINAPELSESLPTWSQENHYFDTSDHRLLRSATMLRLRRIDGRAVILTFKQGREDPDRPGFFDAVELESEVPGSLMEQAVDTPRVLRDHPSLPAVRLRREFGSVDLVFLGRLRTERRRRRLGDLVVELDEVTYPDREKAYELEVETDDPEHARALLQEICERHGVRAAPQRRTKLEEFLRRVGGGQLSVTFSRVPVRVPIPAPAPGPDSDIRLATRWPLMRDGPP